MFVTTWALQTRVLQAFDRSVGLLAACGYTLNNL